MTWFAASIIVGMKRRDGKGSICVYENVVLIEAQTAKEANRIAWERGELEGNLDDGLTIDREPADTIFAGVRKLITIANMGPQKTEEDPPESGTEITYSKFAEMRGHNTHFLTIRRPGAHDRPWRGLRAPSCRGCRIM